MTRPLRSTRRRRPTLPQALAGLWGLLLVGLLASPASAGSGSVAAAGQPDFGRASFGPEISVSARQDRTRVEPGGRLVVAVTLEHSRGWHSWPPVEQAGVLSDSLREFVGSLDTWTSIGVAEGLAGIGVAGPVQWPELKSALVPDPKTFQPVEAMTLAGRAIAFLPIRIADDAESGERTISVEVFYQACDETSCLAPTTETLAITFEVVEDASDAEVVPFAAFDASVFDRMAAAGEAPPAPGGDAAAAVEPEAVAAAPARPKFFGMDLPRPDGFVGILVIGGLAAVGGLILNLTPCVLPVIPIKVLTISQHAGTPGRSLVLGLWMAVGVVAFWVGLGLPVAFLSGFSDPSRLFGIWWVTLAIGLILAAMGVGIMGMFQIQLPQSVYMVSPKADSPGGSFLFGVMTAVLGMPCFGFVAGGLLAGSATLPPITILTIFGGLGVGMALPYAVLAAKPSWVERIPRTGPASELVKQVMGLLMIAASAYFVGAGLIALVTDYPYLAKQLHWWAIAIVAGLAGLWLILRTIQITRKPVPRVVFSLIGLLIGGGAVALAVNTTHNARDRYEKQVAAAEEAEARALESGGTALITSTWIDYSKPLFEYARREGFVVVLDFTADWCLNCKFLEDAYLATDPVRGLLERDDVVMMKVDLTSTKAPGWDLLKELGDFPGPPLLAIYGKGRDEPWLATAYVSGDVVRALAEVGIRAE